MLTHPIAKVIWSQVASTPSGWMSENIGLLAKCARIIKHKCGRAEARQFIHLARAAMLSDKLDEYSSALQRYAG